MSSHPLGDAVDRGGTKLVRGVSVSFARRVDCCRFDCSMNNSSRIANSLLGVASVDYEQRLMEGLAT